MSLIENFERDDWREFFIRTFEYTIELLQTDPHRLSSSSITDDELEGLLTSLREGGRPPFEEKMRALGFDEEVSSAVYTLADRWPLNPQWIPKPWGPLHASKTGAASSAPT
jgi:hypothetical protein